MNSEPQAMPPAPVLPPVLDDGIVPRLLAVSSAAEPPAVGKDAAGSVMPHLEKMLREQQRYLDRIAKIAREHEAALRSCGPFLRREVANSVEFSKDDACRFWQGRLNGRLPLLETLLVSLGELFVERMVLEDPPALASIRGKSVLYLANHQVAIESLLFSMMCTAWSGMATVPLARIEHRTTWLGRLVEFNATHPDVRDTEMIAYFDRQDRPSLLSLLAAFRTSLQAGRKSLLIHVEGEQSRCARKPVARLGSGWLDLALETDAPIVPIRFSGGLPIQQVTADIDFPVGFGRQQFHLGRPIWPQELRGWDPPQRKDQVLARLNAVGPALASEQPAAPNPELADRIRKWQARLGLPEPKAVCLAVLEAVAAPSAEVLAILALARGESPDWPAGIRIERIGWLKSFGEWLCNPSG